MRALSRTQYLPPAPASLMRRGAGEAGHRRHRRAESPSGGASAMPALLAHLAGLALGSALVTGTTVIAALGITLVLP